MTGNPPDNNPYIPTFIGMYTLKYRKPVPCNDLFKWGRWMETHSRKVRQTYVNGHRISTVFLALDHSFNNKDMPVLFETMIFPDQDYQTRCSTWREALKMHWEAVKYAKEK